MTSDVIAFGARRDTISPFTREAEVICAPPAYVIGAEMIVKSFWVGEGFSTFGPLTVVR